MNDPLLVRGAQAPANMSEGGYRGARGKQAVTRKLVCERLAQEPLHHHVDAPVWHLVEIEHTHHVRVLHVDLDVGFAPQTSDLATVARSGASKHFDGDLVAERHVLCGIDHTNATRTDPPADPVFASEHRAREVSRSGSELASQLQTALERGDAVSLKRSGRTLAA